MSNPREIYTKILIAIIGGLFALGGSYLISERSTGSAKYTTDNQTIVALYTRIESLQGQVQSVLEQNAKFSQDNLKLQSEIVHLEQLKNYDEFAVTAFFQHMPLPAWLKLYNEEDDEFVMLKINGAYENEWGVSAIRYENRTDVDIWGKTIAKRFKKSDMQVLDNLKPLVEYDQVPAIGNGSKEWVIGKFPVSIDGQSYNAVGGIAIPYELNGYIEENN